MLSIAAAVALVIAAVAFDAPGHASDAWGEFKRGDVSGQGASRFTSAGGESRYELWSAAWDENASSPLIGTGAGAFEYWWNRHGGAEVVRDAHSLYLQTLGELGIVGILLLGSFLLVVLVGGGSAVIRAPAADNPPLAAALAGCVAFCLTAIFDWMWQIPVLPVATLLLASVLLGPATGGVGQEAEAAHACRFRPARPARDRRGRNPACDDEPGPRERIRRP